MIEKELSRILRIMLYSAFGVIFLGIVLYSFTGRGKIVFETGILMILLSPLAEFLTILVFGFKRKNRKFILLSLWMVAVFLFSSLKFFIF